MKAEIKKEKDRMTAEKYQKDRKALRKMHEILRKQKLDKLLIQGSNKDTITQLFDHEKSISTRRSIKQQRASEYDNSIKYRV